MLLESCQLQISITVIYKYMYINVTKLANPRLLFIDFVWVTAFRDGYACQRQNIRDEDKLNIIHTSDISVTK
ncbi:hypothetical protein XENTR_v10014311 [Xenopus tropicalis]|nr:hypothetical protein XENTR_v10014311 [Xenopus tropicalis]